MRPEAWRTWLKKRICTDEPPELIELVLSSAKGTISTVETWPVGDPREYTDSEKLAELLDTICETAQTDADGWGNVCRYMLRAKVEAGYVRSPVVRFHVDGEEEVESGGEPANAQGMLSQAWRHIEATTRMNTELAKAVAHGSTEIVAKLTERLMHHEAKELERVELIESLYDKRAERELALEKEKATARLRDKALTRTMPLLMAVGGKLLNGGKASKELRDDPSMVALRRLAESISEEPETIARLETALGRERFIALLEVLSTMREPSTDEPEPTEVSDAAE